MNNDNSTLTVPSEIQDILRVSGIKAKGYGILPKFVMHDSDLTLEAKTIYAYLCSLTGAGDIVYPSRDRILNDLKLGLESYYKHFRKLIENGYISVTQTRILKRGSQFAHNVYSLETNPKKFILHAESNDSKVYSKIRLSGLESAGYGIIPRAVMIDPRLDCKAKGIYAYFCTYTGSGNNAFPKQIFLMNHLCITKNTYYKYYNMLLDLNYIKVIQRHIDGRLSVNDYYLVQNPSREKASRKQVAKNRDTELQVPKIPDTSETLGTSGFDQIPKIPDTSETLDTGGFDQIPKKQDTRKQHTRKQHTRNRDTIINSITINSSLPLTDQSINQPSEENPPPAEPASPILTDGRLDAQRFTIFNELWDNKGILYSYKSDERALQQALTILLEGGGEFPEDLNLQAADEKHTHSKRGQKIRYFDEYKNDLYYLIYDALVDLCSFDGDRMYNQMSVTYTKVIDKINENIEYSNGLEGPDRFMFLDIADDIIETYSEVSAGKVIRNPLKYIQAMIWMRLLEKSAKQGGQRS